MAKFKLPEALIAWKVVSSLPNRNGHDMYEVTRRETDGTVTEAQMAYVAFQGDDYNSDNVRFIGDEAKFIRNVIDCGDVSTYIDAEVLDNPSKNKIGLFIITSRDKTLEDELKNREFSEDEVIDFGLQMSDLLSKLEAKGILHGNIKPSNICITENGEYRLRGFTDFESTIDDLSYIAPEIKEEAQPDITTDIYSLGLIMYSMCSKGEVPFESEGLSRDEATQKRLEKQSVPAPQTGSEKLKSVIVIACQPENANRWKNAGNLKNALASIKTESKPSNEPKQEIIPPASTEFDGNVFEEYVYDDFEEEEPAKNTDNSAAAAGVAGVAGAVAAGIAAGEISPGASSEAAEAAEASPEAGEAAESTQEAKADEAVAESSDAAETKPVDEPEIDNRVFDDYQVQTKVFSINDAKKEPGKDYGDYFDDEPEPAPEKPEESKDVDTEFGENGFYEDNSFYAEQNEEEKRSRKGMIIAIVSAVLVVALLAGLGIAGAVNGWFGGNKEPKETQPSTEIYTEDTTAAKATTQPTTVPPTTVAPTTESMFDYPIDVTGAYYDYAKSVLEEQGYNVVEGEYADSEYYEEGIVTSMSVDPDEPLEIGSTIALNISSGLIEPTEEPEENGDNNEDENGGESGENRRNREAPQSEDTSYSQYKNNTSYLSQSEVNNMSRSELNLALNEIYARRGRIFKSSSLSSYFNSQSWYTPKYTEEEFSRKVTLNDYENKNIDMILEAQQNKGYR